MSVSFASWSGRQPIKTSVRQFLIFPHTLFSRKESTCVLKKHILAKYIPGIILTWAFPQGTAARRALSYINEVLSCDDTSSIAAIFIYEPKSKSLVHFQFCSGPNRPSGLGHSRRFRREGHFELRQSSLRKKGFTIRLCIIYDGYITHTGTSTFEVKYLVRDLGFNKNEIWKKTLICLHYSKALDE